MIISKYYHANCFTFLYKSRKSIWRHHRPEYTTLSIKKLSKQTHFKFKSRMHACISVLTWSFHRGRIPYGRWIFKPAKCDILRESLNKIELFFCPYLTRESYKRKKIVLLFNGLTVPRYLDCLALLLSEFSPIINNAETIFPSAEPMASTSLVCSTRTIRAGGVLRHSMHTVGYSHSTRTYLSLCIGTCIVI